MYEIEIYSTQSGNSPMREYMHKLAAKNKTNEIAQIKLSMERLKQYGMAINNTFPNTIRKIQDGVYELRPGSNRVFFFYYIDTKFVVLHAYKKQSNKAPKSQIDKAIKEMKDYIRRNKNE